MSSKKSNENPTGKSVRDVKGEATQAPASNQTQIHAGNIPVLTVRLLDEINQKLGRIATALEKANG